MCDAIAALAHVLQVTTMPKVDLCVFFSLGLLENMYFPVLPQ